MPLYISREDSFKADPSFKSRHAQLNHQILWMFSSRNGRSRQMWLMNNYSENLHLWWDIRAILTLGRATSGRSLPTTLRKRRVQTCGFDPSEVTSIAKLTYEKKGGLIQESPTICLMMYEAMVVRFVKSALQALFACKHLAIRGL